MSFSITRWRKDYTGNGATTVYAYDFPIQATSQLRVIKGDTSSPPVETTLVEGVDYTVSGAGSASGGNVTLAVALTNLYHLTIKRVLTLNQLTDIRNQGAFFPEIHEDAFDQFVMMLQQMQEQIDRALTFQPTSTKTGYAMPDPVALKAFRWNAAATEVELFDPLSASGTAYTPPANAFASGVTTQAAVDAINPRIHGTRAIPISITAGANAIAADSGVFVQTWYVKGNGGAVDLTASNPPIKAGTVVGQRIRLVGCDDANTLTIADVPGNGIVTNGTRVLVDGSILDLEWNGTHWAEASFNNL